MTTTKRRTTVRAVVVQLSGTARAQVAHILEEDGDIFVIGQASTSAEAMALIDELRPDIVTLDLSLPDGSGRDLIEQIMFRAPTPILVLSPLMDDRGTTLVAEALVAGALDSLTRPEMWTSELATELRRRLRVLHKVHVIKHPRGKASRERGGGPVPGQSSKRHVVAIAASTGGPSALAVVLAGLGALAAPVLVVQHLHLDFTTGLVDWMSRESALPVELAKHGDVARAGQVYVAPGGVHLRLRPGFRLELSPEPVTIHRPSADELFGSVAEQAGAGAVGVLMTGMGDDGASGLLAIHRAGGRTLAQDKETSAVFGMPAAAQRLGAVTEMLPLKDLARAITAATRDRS